MPVRIADSMKQQNDLNTFPVAYGADIWLDKKKGVAPANYKSLQAMYNDDELGGGDSIQVTTMPTASETYLDTVLLYIGETGTYKYGTYYKCVSDGETPPTYSWVDAGIGGGSSIFYGTMEEWNALTADEKKKYQFMSDDQNGTDGVYPSAPTTPEIVFDKINQSSNIDATYTVTKKAFHIVRVHCYSEGESHSAQVYLNGVMIGSESSYDATSGVGYTVTIPCNVGDAIRMVVSCGGSGTYDKRSAAIYRLN